VAVGVSNTTERDVSLLSEDLLRRLDALSRRLRMGPAVGRFGGAASRSRGGFREFADRKKYVVGDDARQIDWMAYARGEAPVIKRFHAEESTELRILLDCSASMQTGEPRKLTAARRACAALGYLALAAGYRVHLFATPPASATNNRLTALADLRSKSSSGRLFRLLQDCPSGGKSALNRSIAELSATTKQPGTLLIVSDLLADTSLLHTLNMARHAGNDIALVHVLSPQELHPDMAGDVTLRCVESGDELELTIDRAQLQAYERRLHEWLNSLSDWARSCGQVHVRMASDAELLPVVRRVLESRAQPT
jgi:uncharacterized protein (DUF58 family)